MGLSEVGSGAYGVERQKSQTVFEVCQVRVRVHVGGNITSPQLTTFVGKDVSFSTIGTGAGCKYAHRM